MGDHEFWGLVDQAREDGGDDILDVAEAMSVLLADLPRAELEAYQQRLVLASAQLYTTLQAAAADLVFNGSIGIPVSDDGFTDFRSWVIAQGEQTFRRVVANPDSLADLDDLDGAIDPSGEQFGAAAYPAYEAWGLEVGANDAFPIVEPTRGPTGSTLTQSDIARLLPMLTRRFGRAG